MRRLILALIVAGAVLAGTVAPALAVGGAKPTGVPPSTPAGPPDATPAATASTNTPCTDGGSTTVTVDIAGTDVVETVDCPTAP